MADAKKVTLYAGPSVVANGNGDTVDIHELHTLLRGTIKIGALSGTGRVVFSLETSQDGLSDWRSAFRIDSSRVSAPEFIVDELERYCRLAWTLTGLTSVSFSCEAESHVLYATRRDMNWKSLSSTVTDDVDTRVIAEALLSASGDAEDALNAQYSLPISTWPDSLKIRCAQLAKYRFFGRAGFQPQGVDELLVKDYDDALMWFRSVATRKIVLSGVAEAVIAPVRASSGNPNNPTPKPRYSDDFGDF